jgi:hypothetical protein
MFNRVYFPLIALFWIVMNALLWRAEFGGGNEAASAVSTGVVWQKILTAPDDSTLEISLNEKKVGYCRWVANAGEELVAGKISNEDYVPEGMVRRLGRYTIDLEGNVLLGEPATRLRFNLNLQFATNHVWRVLALRLASRPSVWEIRTAAQEETLSLKYEDQTDKWSRTFSYEELRHPRQLMEEFAGPLPLALLAPIASLEQEKNISLGLQWSARNDWLKIGHAQVRVYRLQARLLDRYQIVVVVSRVGEILRVELPNGVLLVNETLSNL